MTTIKYTPVTGGQTFGDPGKLFESAAKSLNQATSGLADTFDTYRQGAIEEQTRRTDRGLADIEAANTQAAYDNLLSQLNSPEAIRQRYGVADTSAIEAALRQQRFDIGDIEQREAELAQNRTRRADDPLIKDFQAKLALSSPEQIQAYRRDPNLASTLGVQDSGRLSGLLNTSYTDALSRSNAQLERQDLLRSRDKDQFKRNLNVAVNQLAVDPNISEGIGEFNGREELLGTILDEMRLSGRFTAAEIKDFESTNRSALGLTQDNEIRALIKNAPRNAKGKIIKSEFIKLADREGIKESQLNSYFAARDKLTGADKAAAEKLHQQRRQEAIQDAYTKSASPAAIQEYINTTFADQGWFDEDSIDDASSWVSKARRAGMPPIQILQSLHEATEELGDFSETRANRNLKLFKESKGIDQGVQNLNDAVNRARSTHIRLLDR